MSTPDLTRWVTPVSSALQHFELYWTPLTDAPREYLIPAGLSTIGTVIANRVYIPFGGDRIYGNTWTVLLGPSSTYRKSTVVKFARRTLSRLTEGQPQHYVFPDEFSKEALVGRLAEQAQGLLTYREFSGALAGFSRDYMNGTKELLADLYDCPETYERIVGGKTITATNVCLSILAASQTDWLLEKVHENDLRGGFLARFTFWPAFYKRRFLAIPPEPDTAVGNELIRHLNAIRRLEGAMGLPADVRDHYATWLQAHERQLDSLPRAGQLGPFWSRMGITTLKLALVLHVSTAGNLLMTDAALDAAIGLTEYLKLALAKLFEEEIAFTPAMKDRQKVLRLITNRSGLSSRDLLRASSLTKKQLDPVLETLLWEGTVRREKDAIYLSAVSVPVSEGVTDKVGPMIMRVK